MNRIIIISLSVITSISFIIWLGLFFGLNYPEIIKIKEWKEYECLTENKHIDKTYHFYLSCSYCQTAFVLPSCNTALNSQQNADPDLCSNNANFCAHNLECGNGYSCCGNCCSTCTDSKGNNYQCHCSCCDVSFNEQCTVHNDIWYIVKSDGWYYKEDESIQYFTYSKLFKTNNAAAQTKLNSINLTEFIPCWTDPDVPEIIVYSIEYTSGYWVASGIFAGITFLGIALLIFVGILNDQQSNAIPAFGCATFFVFVILGIMLCIISVDTDLTLPQQTGLLASGLSLISIWFLSSTVCGIMYVYKNDCCSDQISSLKNNFQNMSPVFDNSTKNDNLPPKNEKDTYYENQKDNIIEMPY